MTENEKIQLNRIVALQKKKGLDWLMMGKKDAREEQKLLRCEDRYKKSSSDFKNSYPILINCVR